MMLRPLTNPRQEMAQFGRRALVGFVLIILCLVGLAVRFAYLQIERHAEFSARADANRIVTRARAPARGLIYDRHGELLAENVAAFRLEVTPEQVTGMDAMLEHLRGTVALSEDDIERFNTQRKGKHAYQSTALRLKLSEEEIARFEVNRWQFPGVEVVPYLTRYYPHGRDFAHVVGYVGRIDSADLERLDRGRYEGATHVGKIGIERYYESLLHGEPGYEQVEVNADHRPLRVLEQVAPKPGTNLYLTIDAHIQRVAEKAFEGRAGAAVAVDPRNGEVLAMVSVPTFDTNLFVNGISRADYAALLANPDKPLLSRAVQGGYSPGSTIKPFVALAGLERGVRKPGDTILSTGEFFIPGQQRGYRDDKRSGHGRVDLVQAIAQSVNTYFYSLALDMGIDGFASYMAKLGFGKPTGIDLIGESSGVLPSRDWKRANLNQPWYPGETVIAGIGQGYWVVTPLQLAQAVAIVAAHGVPHRLHLLRATQKDMSGAPVPVRASPSLPSVIENPADWAPVKQGMVEVVNGPRGTARSIAEGFPYLIAGKTGTAERYSRTTEAWSNIMDVPIESHQVLFEAFTPADDARIAVVVVLEAGRTGGRDAAPIVRKMLDAWMASTESRGGQ